MGGVHEDPRVQIWQRETKAGMYERFVNDLGQALFAGPY